MSAGLPYASGRLSFRVRSLQRLGWNVQRRIQPRKRADLIRGKYGDSAWVPLLLSVTAAFCHLVKVVYLGLFIWQRDGEKLLVQGLEGSTKGLSFLF